MPEMPDSSWDRLPPYQPPEPPSAERPRFHRKIRGSCHCGRVTYWLSRDRPLASKYCHCSDCRTLHGAPFQWAAIFHKPDVAFENGTRHLRFYHSATQQAEHHLPCKVSCAHCAAPIMDEGRNMVLLFPTLLALANDEQRRNFHVECHIFYPQRVVDIPDGKPKWAGLDNKSRLLDDPSSAIRDS